MRPHISFFPRKIKLPPSTHLLLGWSPVIHHRMAPSAGLCYFLQAMSWPSEACFPKNPPSPPSSTTSETMWELGQASVTAETVTAWSSQTQRSHILTPSLSWRLPPSLSWWTWFLADFFFLQTLVCKWGDGIWGQTSASQPSETCLFYSTMKFISNIHYPLSYVIF